MDTRRSSSSARVRPISATKLLRMVGKALDVVVPESAHDAVRIPMPDFSESNFRDRYLCKELLRKYPDFDLGVDKDAEAITSLIQQEDRNRATNDRLASRAYGEDPRVRQVYYLSCRKAAEILGDFDIEAFLHGARFGPGATTRIGGETVGLDRKLSGKPHVTLSAFPLAYWYLSGSPLWAYNIDTCVSSDRMLTVCEHDNVLCVPKNALTSRTICPQPDMNGFFQLGAGYHMRERLYAAGIDLSDQSINQRRALLASQTGELATVDVKGASNSVTCQLVYDHLGSHDHTRTNAHKWFQVLEALRTTSGWIGTGVDHLWELWSSMGNGYTFELETLVFYCLTHSVCTVLGIPPDVTVYGDDIICPSEAVPLLTDVFAFSGFELNLAKSYWNTSGPIFRESCGKHYLDGVDVTPLYVDEALDSVESIVLLANNLLRWACLPGFGRDGRLESVYYWVLSHLPNAVLNTAIPFGEANDGLIKDFDEALPSVRYSCPKHKQGEVVQAVGSDYQPRAMYLPRVRVGYEARTVRMVNRAKVLHGSDGYLAWHYLHAVHKFSPRPKYWTEAKYEPYKVKGLKRSLDFKTRVVSSWPFIGPWVSVDPLA